MSVIWFFVLLLTISVDPHLLWLVPAELLARHVVNSSRFNWRA